MTLKFTPSKQYPSPSIKYINSFSKFFLIIFISMTIELNNSPSFQKDIFKAKVLPSIICYFPVENWAINEPENKKEAQSGLKDKTKENS
jgi:hypothetical protein